jgi:GH35 family endo-1,4-beta-xylanase
MDLSHRTGEATLTVVGPDGRPLADREVTVAQRRHAFAFGNIAFELVELVGGGGPEGPPADPDDPELGRFAEQWLSLFNTATLPFYWGGYEPRPGVTDAARLGRAARWLAERGVTVKGHPLVWHTVQPGWLLDLDPDEVERRLRQRVRDVVGAFAGLIDTWDAINEAVIMPVFANGDNAITPLARARGRIAMVRLAFDEARATNPSATLVLNDFDLSPAYECLIEGVLEAGVPVDAIGLQTHMHQGFRGEEYLSDVLDRFARYGRPLHLTETTLVSGDLMPPDVVDLNDYQVADWPSTPEGEARQADDIVRHYRLLLGHPAVEAVTYWGLDDRGAWLNAPGGLVRADGTPKPSHTALAGLIKGEWWLGPTDLRTDAEGRVRVQGFHGDYTVTAGDRTAAFSLAATPGDLTLTVV